jgi:DNA-binding MarR family transcriptional regulator
MASDFFEETFADLDKFYPGSKRQRREPAAPKTPVITSWEDAFFEKYLPSGRKIQMYTLGSLAKALGRSTKTMRQWLDKGILPASPYRMPAKVGRNGKEYAGRRLYSRAMVEAAVDIFTKAGLMDTERVEWSLHRSLVDKIAEAWENIRAEEMQNN